MTHDGDPHHEHFPPGYTAIRADRARLGRQYETVEDLGEHLRHVHGRTKDYAALACDEWARGSALCPFCDLYGVTE